MTYADYSMCNAKRSGVFYNQGQPCGKFAWNPVATDEFHVQWGDPKNWPPPYYKERFIKDGDWLYCDGWWDNGTYYKIQVISEKIANADGTNIRDIPRHPDGMQHYVLWNNQSVAYRIGTNGTITEQLTGNKITFYHRQIWYPSKLVTTNPYLPDTQCIAQYELWQDDNPKLDGIKTTKTERTNWLGLNIGPAFVIKNVDGSRYDLKEYKNW